MQREHDKLSRYNVMQIIGCYLSVSFISNIDRNSWRIFNDWIGISRFRTLIAMISKQGISMIFFQ